MLLGDPIAHKAQHETGMHVRSMKCFMQPSVLMRCWVIQNYVLLVAFGTCDPWMRNGQTLAASAPRRPQSPALVPSSTSPPTLVPPPLLEALATLALSSFARKNDGTFVDRFTCRIHDIIIRIAGVSSPFPFRSSVCLPVWILVEFFFLFLWFSFLVFFFGRLGVRTFAKMFYDRHEVFL